jgi:hypothetical protein
LWQKQCATLNSKGIFSQRVLSYGRPEREVGLATKEDCLAGPGAPPTPSPVRARFASSNGSQTITVLVKEASSIKPTFVQECPLALPSACYFCMKRHSFCTADIADVRRLFGSCF